MRTTCFVLLLAVCFIGCASPQKKYRKTSTPELKLRHAQCEQFLLGLERKGFEFKFGPPLMMMGDGGKADRIKEKETIETELLRRYTAGDKEAHLPIFGN